MNRKKLHISTRLQLIVAIVLITGCLVGACGVTFARYRVQQAADLLFQAQKNAMVYLGVEQEGAFVCQQSAWQETEDGTMALSFAISNGQSQEVFAQADQTACVRLVASLGAWSAESTGQLILTVGESTYIATAERISEGTALFSEFGEGWIFRFLNDAGEEYTFPLDGGALHYTVMQLTFTDTIQNTNLLQLRVVAENQ